MAVFEVEQYQRHAVKIRVVADTISEAIAKVLDGEGDDVDNSLEYIEVDEDAGMPADENQDIVEGLEALGVSCHDVIPSIRGVEEVEDDGDTTSAV